jgi:hypothetical protein
MLFKYWAKGKGMDEYVLRVEPFEQLFKDHVAQAVRELATLEDEESAITNLLFLQKMKERMVRENDGFMVRWYLRTLQQEHYPYHSLRPTFRRAQRIIYARDNAIGVLAINAALLELQDSALAHRIPSTYLATMDMPEFEEIDSMEKPEEYAIRDGLLLGKYGIGIWKRKH